MTDNHFFFVKNCRSKSTFRFQSQFSTKKFFSLFGKKKSVRQWFLLISLNKCGIHLPNF